MVGRNDEETVEDTVEGGHSLLVAEEEGENEGGEEEVAVGLGDPDDDVVPRI